eukprot:scaffold10.g2369.t1
MQTAIAAQRFGKRSGELQREHFLSEDYLRQLEPVVQQLNADGGAAGVKFDRRSLGNLVAGFLEFVEMALGLKSHMRPLPKLPAGTFLDTSLTGPVYMVASLCAELMKAKGLKAINWHNPQFRRDYNDLYSRLRAQLLRLGYVQNPRVFLHPSCGADVGRLAKAAKDLQGEVAQSDAAQGLTHVIYPTPPQQAAAAPAPGGQAAPQQQAPAPGGAPQEGPSSEPLEYRVLEVRGGLALVHWRYLPDSYDEWVPAAQVDISKAGPEKKARGTWKVHARWLEDSERYNEWMNPRDYETPEGAAEAGADGKRKREGEEEGAVDEDAAKRARAGGSVPEVAADGGEQVVDGVVRQRVLAPHRKAMDPPTAVDISQGQRQPAQPSGAPPPRPPPARSGNGSEGSQQRGPAAAATPSRPHLEREHFADYLAIPAGAAPAGDTLEANTRRYVGLRNAIIELYREDPGRELTFIDVRRKCVGDSNLMRRIFQFLDGWQLINYTAVYRSPSSGEVVAGALPPSLVKGAPLGMEGLFALPRRAGVLAGAQAAVAGGGGAARVVVQPGAFAPAQPWAPAAASKRQYHCGAPGCGAECSALRYHCTRQPDLDLCPTCYREGRGFGPALCGKDFARLTALDAAPAGEDGWSRQETLLLLEALEKYGGESGAPNWAAVAEHVGGKTQMQCVLHFLQLPIEDTLWGGSDVGDASILGLTLAQPPTPGQRTGLAAALPHDAPPFADVANPVVAQISFLAAMVSPKVAQAAAAAALEALAEAEADNGAGGAAAAAANGREGGAGGAPPTQLRVAAAIGLASAAARAKQLADAEEREMQRLVVAAIEAQQKKVDAKLRYLETLDRMLLAERANVARMQKEFLNRYAALMAQKPEQQDKEEQGGAAGVAGGEAGEPPVGATRRANGALAREGEEEGGSAGAGVEEEGEEEEEEEEGDEDATAAAETGAEQEGEEEEGDEELEEAAGAAPTDTEQPTEGGAPSARQTEVTELTEQATGLGEVAMAEEQEVGEEEEAAAGEEESAGMGVDEAEERGAAAARGYSEGAPGSQLQAAPSGAEQPSSTAEGAAAAAGELQLASELPLDEKGDLELPSTAAMPAASGTAGADAAPAEPPPGATGAAG